MLRGHISGTKARGKSQQVCSQDCQGKDGSKEDGGEGRVFYCFSRAAF